MYSRFNPPKYKNHMAPAQVVRKKYDFARDDNHNLIVVESGTVNYSAMAAAAAAGCDFKAIHEALRAGRVSLSKEALTNNIAPGTEYRDTTQDPKSLIEADNKIKAAAAQVMESYSKLPEDLRNGMTISQFEQAVKSGYLEKYAKMKEAMTPIKEELPNASK